MSGSYLPPILKIETDVPRPNLAESAQALGIIRAALAECSPEQKCAQLGALDAAALADALARAQAFAQAPLAPGRPPRPELVHPRDVPTRGLGTPAGRAALVHAVAHIEFNAINLALDACSRFAGQMPAAFYADWLGVARDEARHFALLRGRLNELGYDYGDFPAHNGLWEAAEKTAHDVLVRMALVPRVLEARGLDVTPGIIHRLREVGDTATVAILDIILAEEVAHVAAGTRWFYLLCAQRGLEPVATFRQLVAEHRMSIRPPFNAVARAQAGFVEAEWIEWSAKVIPESRSGE